MSRSAISKRACLRVAAACALAAVAALLTLVPAASADVTVCAAGSEAGQCNQPKGVAVDFETGRVYVADNANNRIDVFKETGEFEFAFGWGVDTGTTELQTCTAASSCQAGLSGSEAGQFGAEVPLSFTTLLIAVDNGAASSSHHDIYVAEPVNNRVQKFSPSGAFLGSFGSEGSGPGQFEDEGIRGVGVTAAGVVYVADSKHSGEPGDSCGGEGRTKRVQKFEGSGALIGASEVTDVPCVDLSSFAVDSTGDFYLGNSAPAQSLRKYEASEPIATPIYEKEAGIAEWALAVDASDNLYAAQGESRKNESSLYSIFTIAKYTPAGTLLRRYGYGSIDTDASVKGLAARHTAAGDVYESERDKGEGLGNKVKYLAEAAAGPLFVPQSVEAAPIGNTKATLNAEINPEGKATDYQIEYVTQKSFETEGGWSSPKAKSTEPTPLGAEDFSLHYVNTQIGCASATRALIEAEECLSPETEYRFRVKASNPDGEGNSPIEGAFKTKQPLELGAAWSSEVGTDVARISAEVNPLTIAASGYFQVVDDAHFKASGFAAASDVPDVAHGQAPISFGNGESPAIRSALLSPLPAGTIYHYRLIATDIVLEPATFIGEAHSFTTFEANAAPPCANDPFRIGPAAFLPDCRAYEMVSPLDKESGDIKALGEATTALPAVLEQSSVDGGRLAYGTYRAFGDAPSAPYTSQYIASRGQGGWASHAISPLQARQAGEVTSRLDTEFKLFSPDLCEAWLRGTSDPPLTEDAATGYYDLYRRQDDECGGPQYEALTTLAPTSGFLAGLELQGASADGSAAVYVADGSLATASPSAAPQPGSCASNGLNCNLELYYRRAGSPLRYVCVLPNGISITGGCSAGTNADDHGQGRRSSYRHAISADGDEVFWSTFGSGSSKIYLRQNPGQAQSKFDGAGKCKEAAKACTLAVSQEAEEETGLGNSQFWTAAEDGSRAIFTSGTNLYEFDTAEAKDHLIAHRVLGVAGASADARWIYFASEEALTGPNAQGRSPVLFKSNLYLFHAGTLPVVATLGEPSLSTVFGSVDHRPLNNTAHLTADGRHLAFMTQTAPTGYDNLDAGNGKADAEVYLYDAGANEGAGGLLCASCNPSGARPVGADIVRGVLEFWAAAQLPVWENTLYQARSLATDGNRLYFESSDALTPRDGNGVGDVYEWEAPGTGSCVGEDAPGYSALNEGCVNLISSGQSPRAAEFVDADPSGHDVFFSTLSGLLPQDYGLLDIYDARIGGGFPQPPAPPAPCEGDACQSPPEAPNDPTPASAAFKGAGDATARKAKKKKHAKKKRHARGHRRRANRGGKSR